MLRKFAYNKIFRTTGMLVLLILLLLFPVSKEYSLEDDSKLSYASKQITKKEVFLLDKNGYISRCNIDITYNDDNDKAHKLMELLIANGKYENKLPNGFTTIIPSDTLINDIKINEDNITVDISDDILELDNIKFKKALELITYNLTTIEDINNVYLKVNGKLLDYYPDNKKILHQPLRRNDGVNEEYDATSYKNVNKTTIYYVGKNNANFYYIPVTKTSNDNREKIQIIIDELTSTNFYDTNLMSFLNYNAKLNDYSLKDGILSVNFNNYLFDDVQTSTILEEVIYSVALSVRDNYDVDEVSFLVDGVEITKSVLKDIE